LRGQVGRHRVDAVGQVLPGTANRGDLGLAAELAFRAHLAGDAGNLTSEGVELIDHRIDGVLELQDLALGVGRDLLAEVAVGDRRGHVGDVAHLRGQVGRDRVDGVGQVLPGTAHAQDHGLTAELAFGADLTRHPRDFERERAELIDHRVDGVLELQELAADIDGDLLGEIPGRHGGRHIGDVAHLQP